MGTILGARLAILHEPGRTTRPLVRGAAVQRDLVERARGGDHDAFAALAGATISRLDAAAWLILRDVEQAKDAVQNALVRAWRRSPSYRSTSARRPDQPLASHLRPVRPDGEPAAVLPLDPLDSVELKPHA